MDATREALPVAWHAPTDDPCEGKVGPARVAEKLVRPLTPGNAGRGKELQVEGMGEREQASGVAATAYHPDVRAELPDAVTCTSEGDDPHGRRRQGVSRPDDAPVGPAQGCGPGATARETRPLVQTGKPVCEPHDSTGEPGAGNRHAGFGERGEETCPRDSDCGPARKRRMSPQRSLHFCHMNPMW